MKRVLLMIMLWQTIAVFANDTEATSKLALKGGIANASVAWLGPITAASIKIAFGGEYWFNNNIAVGVDVGMGGEGYGKSIGVTSHSLVNLKTGGFILDPGVSGTFALNRMNQFALYGGLRLGFPLYSGYPGAVSLGPALGTLIFFNDWIALDLAASCNVVATFKFNYLATVLTIGSIGFRLFI